MPHHQDSIFKRGRVPAASPKPSRIFVGASSTSGTVYTDIPGVEHAKIATPGIFGERESWQTTKSDFIFPGK